MINYIKSDLYRLYKKRLNYILVIITTIAQLLLAIIIEYFARTEPGFPYGHTKYYYSNVFGISTILIVITCFLASYLLGKDRDKIPLSLSLDVERKTIFIGKFIVTFVHFIIIFLFLSTVTYLIGEVIISNSNSTISLNFVISLINLLPVLISAFSLTYSCIFIFNNELIATLIVLLFFRVFSLVITGLAQISSFFSYIKFLFPGNELNGILSSFMDENVYLNIESWIFNVLLTFIVIFIGLRVAVTKDYS